MSFASPLWLLGLLLLPLAISAYVSARRRRRVYAVRFTAVPALKEAAKAVPAWRRHVPAALVLAAVASLVLAMAKPERTVGVPVEQASIMLVTDHSGSMQATDVEPDRLTAAQKAARAFIKELPDEVRLGVVAYSTGADAVRSPTEDHDATRKVIDDQQADGATATGDALQTALDALTAQRSKGRRAPAAIVLLSDGKTTSGRDPVTVAENAKRLRIPIYTVALGTEDGIVTIPGFNGSQTIPVPPDPETLREIASTSGGKAFRASDEERLTSIYKDLGSRLSTKQQKQEATATFAAAGLVLLMGAAFTSTRGADAASRSVARSSDFLRFLFACAYVALRCSRSNDSTASTTTEEPMNARRIAVAAAVGVLAAGGAGGAIAATKVEGRPQEGRGQHPVERRQEARRDDGGAACRSRRRPGRAARPGGQGRADHEGAGRRDQEAPRRAWHRARLPGWARAPSLRSRRPRRPTRSRPVRRRGQGARHNDRQAGRAAARRQDPRADREGARASPSTT